MIRAVIFDFNGVLVDDEHLHFELFQRVLGEEDLALDEATYYERYVGCDDEGCFRLVFESAGLDLDPPKLARLIARKGSYYQERIRRDGFRFFPGAVDLVHEAAERWTLAIVSGALREEIDAALEQESLRDRFKIRVAAEDVDRGKPDPEGFLRAVEELNSRPPLPARLFHPHEILVIEDTAAGLQAAGAAGLLTAAVCHTFPAEQLSAADLVYPEIGAIEADGLQERLAEASRS